MTMTDSYSDRYKEAGVDITAGYEAVRQMKPLVERTFTKGVIGSLGGFGGLFAPDLSGISDPVLVSGTDGVGTKLKIAFLMDKHDTVGIDCVAMSVNDVVCSGARPLFFLDYVAVGRNVPERVAAIVKGVTDGCLDAGCALIGGETAEMPGLYEENEYDLAGFCVGLTDRSKITDCSAVQDGDVILGIASSGLHSNGFSLVRKVFDVEHADLGRHVDALGMPLGEALLTPTRIYVKPVLRLLESVAVKGIAHITGGGFYENLPRSLPDGVGASIEKRAVPVLPIFDMIRRAGHVDERDMFNTFNMGVGMTLIVAAADLDAAMAVLEQAGERPVLLGHTVSGEGVTLC